MIHYSYKLIKCSTCRIQSFLFRAFLVSLGYSVGKGLKIYGYPIVYSRLPQLISIGPNTTISSRYISNSLGARQSIIKVLGTKGCISIGSNFSASGCVILSTHSINIGANVMLGNNVTVIDSDFHPMDYHDRRINNNNILDGPVIINDDVWIGANSMILKGVSIGRRSVIGACSVVTKDVPQDVVVAGNPARIIRSLNTNSNA